MKTTGSNKPCVWQTVICLRDGRDPVKRQKRAEQQEKPLGPTGVSAACAGSATEGQLT